MQVFIHGPTVTSRHIVVLDAKTDTTVEHLKLAVARVTGTPAEEQTLVYAHKLLLDHYLLADVNSTPSAGVRSPHLTSPIARMRADALLALYMRCAVHNLSTVEVKLRLRMAKADQARAAADVETAQVADFVQNVLTPLQVGLCHCSRA
jgi:hypothetical protein